ncbi:MAG TPA: hypothetical protein PK609_00975 [Candidatus Paceibacterota bacterium]|nr:hypothetical protein [Candidatus Paceibacterota bacterium]
MSRASTYALMSVFEDTLNMRIEVSFEEALGFFSLLRSYNQLEGARVHELLHAIDDAIPRTAYPDTAAGANPNNGKRAYSICVGREGSPVLYIKRYVHEKEDPLPTERVRLIKRAARKALADEIDYEMEDVGIPGYGVRIEQFRFWWD